MRLSVLPNVVTKTFFYFCLFGIVLKRDHTAKLNHGNYTMTFQMKASDCLNWPAFTGTEHILSGENTADRRQQEQLPAF